MKKTLLALVLATFLLSLPVFGEAREALPGDETQMPATLVETGSPAASLQTISLGIGRRRVRRRRHYRRRRRHLRRHLRRRYARLPRRAVVRYRGRTYVVTRRGRRVYVRPR